MESAGDFPFPKLRNFTFSTLDVLMYVDHQDAYKFMYNINKEGRQFIINNFITVRNGFVNDGLIDFVFERST